MYFTPSIYAHITNGILIAVASILLYKNYSKVISLEPYKLILLTLLFSISIGIHGLSHLGIEKEYNYNPMNIIYRNK